MFSNDIEDRTEHLPNGALLVECGYRLVGVGAHRDSNAIEESNFMVASDRLGSAGDIGRPWDYGTEEWSTVGVAHFRHWAVGWVDELVYRPGVDANVDTMVQLIRRSLEDYPILDEEHYSELEWSSNHPDDDDLCYSDDDDCGCERIKA